MNKIKKWYDSIGCKSNIMAFLILMVGVEVGKTSIDKILHPTPVEFSVVAIIGLLMSIGMKLWMSLFVGKLGRLIDSKTLAATSADSRNDVISTLAVLAAVQGRNNAPRWVRIFKEK